MGSPPEYCGLPGEGSTHRGGAPALRVVNRSIARYAEPTGRKSHLDTMEADVANTRDKIDTQKAIDCLNTILELELAGVVRYLHYSLMVFGHARIPIIGWMRNQATEGMDHAAMAGEHVTSLGGHPSLKIGKLVETHKHDISQILQEALEHERATLEEYYSLLAMVEGKSVWLEEYAREQIKLEEQHIAEVEKMMRKPGDLSPAGR
jgi:bacterioferritin